MFSKNNLKNKFFIHFIFEYECNNFVLSLLNGELKLPSPNNTVLALLIHEIPLRNMLNPYRPKIKRGLFAQTRPTHTFSKPLALSFFLKD